VDRRPCIQETYFCNIHREDDKVTQWIRERWAEAQLDNNTYPIEANMCMARLVNRIESLEKLQWPWQRFYDNIFEDIAGTTKPFWGSAYVVTTHGQPIGKVEYVCGVLQAAFEHPPMVGAAYTLKAAHKHLMQLEGFGSFMAAQVVADLKNTPQHCLFQADDWWHWSAHGPGSLRGINWLFADTHITPASFESYIRIGHSLLQDNIPAMCRQDFQNCLCEFDKYMRVKTKSGKSKRKYNGTA